MQESSDTYDELLAVRPGAPVDPLFRITEATRRAAHISAKDTRLFIQIGLEWIEHDLAVVVKGRLSANGKLLIQQKCVTSREIRQSAVCPLALAIGEIVRRLLVASGDKETERAMKGPGRDTQRLKKLGLMLKTGKKKEAGRGRD